MKVHMDKKIEEQIKQLYRTGNGINYISRLFKVKKDKITKLVKGIEVVEEKREEPKKEEPKAKVKKVARGKRQITIVEVKEEVNNIIEIKLPVEEEDYKTSIKVNKVVMEEFREFCKVNKDFTAKDLVSMAIVEYMDKYK